MQPSWQPLEAPCGIESSEERSCVGEWAVSGTRCSQEHPAAETFSSSFKTGEGGTGLVRNPRSRWQTFVLNPRAVTRRSCVAPSSGRNGNSTTTFDQSDTDDIAVGA